MLVIRSSEGGGGLAPLTRQHHLSIIMVDSFVCLQLVIVLLLLLLLSADVGDGVVAGVGVGDAAYVAQGSFFNVAPLGITQPVSINPHRVL